MKYNNNNFGAHIVCISFSYSYEFAEHMGYSKYESDLSISVGWEDIREVYKMLYMHSNGPHFLWKSQWHYPIVKSGCLIAPCCG